MHVKVDLTAAMARVSLAEPADCRRFDVVVHGTGDRESLDQALVAASVGRTDDDEVLVDVAAVRRLASGSVADSWEADFQGMLDFARSKRWLTDDGQAIRAHVEWR
ncbi:MAG TPA: hypothetical protein VNC61_08915 [Acidimicrobiales bacterium]|nr:hypothetical protein [Acidimicrobiales bacterium]